MCPNSIPSWPSSGGIRDFHGGALDGLLIPKSADALGKVESAHVQVRGVCSACAARKRKAGRRRKR